MKITSTFLQTALGKIQEMQLVGLAYTLISLGYIGRYRHGSTLKL